MVDMSFNSPAKQERIERHLMRQRGAGVRTVSSNFGFAFGPISAPTSSDATPTRTNDEPPTKRRKTILANEVVISEDIMTKSVAAPKSIKCAKVRRKLDLEADDLHQPDAADEDSFIAGLGTRRATVAKSKAKKTPVTKKPPAVKSKTQEESAIRNREAVQILETQPATVSRPTRRAAATAAPKRAERHEEEAIQIDKNMRTAHAREKSGRSRKREVVVEQDTGVREVEHALQIDALEQPPKERRAGRKRKANDEDTGVEQIVHAANEEAGRDVATEHQTGYGSAGLVLSEDPSEAQIKVAPRKRGHGRKRKAKNADDTLEQAVDVAVDAEKDDFAEKIALQHDEKSDVSQNMRSRKPASRNALNANKKKQPPPKRSKQKVAESALAVEPPEDTAANVAGDHECDCGANHDSKRKVSSRSTKATRTQRQPLAETNMNNMTMVSASPEKLPQDVPQESTLPKAEPPPKALGSNQPLPTTKKPEPKRAKLNIKRDAVENTSQRSGSPAQTRVQQAGDISGNKDSQQSSLDRTLEAVASVTSAADSNGDAAAAIKRRRNFIHPAEEHPDVGIVSGYQTLAPGVNEPNLRDKFQSEKADRSDPADARDEDVDWLLAPHPEATFPKQTTARSKSGSVMRKRKFKMPEMDLDDLLSNIATFAQEKSKPGAVVAKDVKLFAGGGKPRGGSRKKTKT